MSDELLDYTAWLNENPQYRLQCFIAWKCGEETFRKFLANDDEIRAFIVRNFYFLQALFELPEFHS